MKCNKCGYENNDNAKFCNECGVKLYEKMEDNINKNVEEFHGETNEADIINAVKEENNKDLEIKENNNNYKSKIQNIRINRKYIIISLIAICAIIGMTLIGVNLNYFSKIRQADEAMNQKDYNKAVDLYSEALNIFNKSDTKSKLSEAKELQLSQNAYNEGMRDFELKGYYTAFLEFKNVIEKDADNYEDAKKKQEECKNLYTTDKLAEAKKDVSDGKYDVAITCLDNILKLDPQNSDVINLRSQYNSEKKEADAKAKTDAEAKKAQQEADAKAKAEQAKQADIAKRKSEGVRIGMTKDEVLASNWGKPKSINKTTGSYGTHEQWVYGGNNYLYFENGILKTIQN